MKSWALFRMGWCEEIRTQQSKVEARSFFSCIWGRRKCKGGELNHEKVFQLVQKILKQEVHTYFFPFSLFLLETVTSICFSSHISLSPILCTVYTSF